MTTMLNGLNRPYTGSTTDSQSGRRYTHTVKPIWILQKQETVSGSGISWAVCKPAHRSRQITTPSPHHQAAGNKQIFRSRYLIEAYTKLTSVT